MKILEWLRGKKTYIVAFAAAVYGAGIQEHLWQHITLIDYLLAAAGAATLRAGMNNAVTNSTNGKT